MKIKQSNLPGAHLRREIVQGSTNDQQAEVGDGDEVSLRIGEERAQRVKVAVSERLGPRGLLRQTLGTCADVEHQVCLPSEKLVGQQGGSIVEGSLLEQLLDLVEQSGHLGLEVLVGGRYEDGILLDVAVVAVVSGVGDLPREVGHHEQRVSRPSHHVVQRRVWRKGAVSTLMTENPDTDAHASLEEGVGDPGPHAHPSRRQLLDICGRPDENGGVNEITSQIGERLGRGPLEAVRRNLASQESIGDFFGL